MPALSSAALHPAGAVASGADELARPLGLTAAPPLPRSSDELPPAARRALTVGVLAAHVLGLWGLMQIDSVRNAVGEVAPMVVDMIAPPLPPPPPPPAPKPPAPQPVKLKAPPPPLVTAPPSPAPAAFVAAPPPPEPVVVAAEPQAPPAPPAAPAAPPAPPAPPAIMRVSAGALQYTTMPPVEMPRMSRRLGESGMVVVRVIVNTAGSPRLVALHTSSGFARLDEQALGAMRAARFKPCTREGQAVECEALAPIAYELEK